MLQELEDLITEEGHLALVQLREVQGGNAKEAINGM
jgi:hypothetical protein